MDSPWWLHQLVLPTRVPLSWESFIIHSSISWWVKGSVSMKPFTNKISGLLPKEEVHISIKSENFPSQAHPSLLHLSVKPCKPFEPYYDARLIGRLIFLPRIGVEYGMSRSPPALPRKLAAFEKLTAHTDVGGKMCHSLRSMGSAALNIVLVASGGLDMWVHSGKTRLRWPLIAFRYWEIGVSYFSISYRCEWRWRNDG